MTSDVIFSQYNGSSIPLSNIVESGDGYIRYSDGTQICYGTIESRAYSDQRLTSTITSTKMLWGDEAGTLSYSFSKSFKYGSTPSIMVMPVKHVKGQRWVACPNKGLGESQVDSMTDIDYLAATASYSSFSFYGSFNITSRVYYVVTYLSYIAIGRWK